MRKMYLLLVVLATIGNSLANGTHLEFTDFQESTTVTFADTAPAWRVVAHGLNLEGKCPSHSDECSAAGELVWSNLRFKPPHEEDDDFADNPDVFQAGDFNTYACCPICNQKIRELVGVGFSKCKYRYKGVREDQPTEKQRGEGIADDTDGFTYFGKHSFITWQRLQVRVTPLQEDETKEDI